MCQSRAEGGRRCAIHLSLTRGSKTIASTASGLSRSQLNAVFADLRAEGRNRPAPDQYQYSAFLQRQFNAVNVARMTVEERLSVRAVLTASTNENLPDGPTFYALQRLTTRSRSQARAIRREIVNLAPQMGVTPARAMAIFTQAVEQEQDRSDVSAPSGYISTEGSQARHDGLPHDEPTARAYSRVRQAATNSAANPNISTERRVTRREVDSSFISEIGYDSSDGRLEVVFRSTPEQVHAYRNVPASTWEEMNRPGGSIGSVYTRVIRRNSDYAYANRNDAENDAYARRCADCGQFAAASHSCPQSRGELSEAQVQAFINEGDVPGETPTPEISAGEIEIQEELESRETDAELIASVRRAVQSGEMVELTPRRIAEMELEEDPENLDALLRSLAGTALEQENGETTEPEPTPTRTRRTRSTEPRAPRQTAAERRLALSYEERATNDLTRMGTTSVVRVSSNSGFSLPGATSVYLGRESRIRAIVNRGEVARSKFSIFGDQRIDGRYSSYSASGSIDFYSDGNEWKARFVDRRCSCAEYRENSQCVHTRELNDANAALVASATEKSMDASGYARRRAVANATEGQTPVVRVAESRRMRNMASTIPGVRQTSHTPNEEMTHSANDYINTGSVTDIRAALGVGQAVVPISWRGYRTLPFRGDEDEYARRYRAGRVEHFMVTGNVTMQNGEDGAAYVTARELRCSCDVYRRNSHCRHVDYVVNTAPVLAARATNTTTANIGDLNALAEAATRKDWSKNDEHREEMTHRHAAVAEVDSYSKTFESFNSDFEAAQEKISRGESPLKFVRENATGGICAPETGRKFGVELEFDLTGVDNKYEALQKIGRELHAAGLTTTAQQQRYHAAAANGYAKWSFEQDCTVDGEIVSPIMSDTPEDWAQLEKVCDIITRNGGKATKRTGSHVHVSSGTYGTDVDKHAELAKMNQQYEDTIYRLATNPASKTHRPMRWCAPNTSLTDDRIESIRQGTGYYGHVSQLGSSHGLGLNFQSAGSGNTDRDNVEFRQWDGSINPAVIQAQVMMSAAMVDAAERNATTRGLSKVPREDVGSHKTRQTALLGRSKRKLTKEELSEDSATTRSFIDTLFTRREDKAKITALFAMTSWQKSTSR